MFVRMLTVHCDQNNRYEITTNQASKINEMSDVMEIRYRRRAKDLGNLKLHQRLSKEAAKDFCLNFTGSSSLFL